MEIIVRLILIIAALVFAIFAVAGAPVFGLAVVKEVAISAILLSVAMLIGGDPPAIALRR